MTKVLDLFPLAKSFIFIHLLFEVSSFADSPFK